MSEQTKRALIVSPTPTWPLNYGNRKRVFMVCSKLQKLGFEIHFVHYASEVDWRNNIPVESRRIMNSQWDMVDHIFPSVNLHCYPENGVDHTIDEWWDPALEIYLKSIFKSRDYDVVIVNYTWLSKALELVPDGILKVLDTHDKFSDRRLLLEANGISKEYFHTTESEEKVGISRADLIWAIKDEEKAFFESLNTGKHIETLIYIDEYRDSTGILENTGYLTAGFIGARNNINKVNIVNFINVSVPIFEKYLAPVKIKIAGSVCDDLEAIDSSYFDIVGRVQSVNDFYDDVDLAIVPMEFSTGLKIKSGEAISYSKPLISHKHAMEGYPSTHFLHECESMEHLATELVRLSYDSGEIQNLKKASVESYRLIDSQIEVQLSRIAQVVNSLRKIIIILPKEFGDESTILHWHSLTMIDWLSWNFDILCVSQYSDVSCEVFNVRFLSEKIIEALIVNRTNSIVFNMDESFVLPLASLVSVKLLSFIPDERRYESNVTHMLFGSSSEKDRERLLGFGHLKMPLFSGGAYGNQNGVVILGQKLSAAQLKIRDFIRSCGNTFSENASFSDYSGMQEFVSSYAKKYSSIPQYIINLKPFYALSYAEQLFVDFTVAHGGKYINGYGVVDVVHILDVLGNNADYNNDYQERFFSVWKFWEKKLLAF